MKKYTQTYHNYAKLHGYKAANALAKIAKNCVHYMTPESPGLLVCVKCNLHYKGKK